MTHYLLSVHSVEGEARDPMTEEEMRQFMERVGVLEEEMKSAGAWVFGGALHDPDTATVARVSDDEVLTTDGPFAESKEHLGGFYIIEAEDLESAPLTLANLLPPWIQRMEPLWSPWVQPVAINRKSDGAKSRGSKRKPLPWVATGCRSERMVRRGRRFESVRGLKSPAHRHLLLSLQARRRRDVWRRQRGGDLQALRVFAAPIDGGEGTLTEHAATVGRYVSCSSS
jgi:hypothetical protein